jgi:hypothetical protein
MFTVTASLVICIGLMGCNRNQQAQAPAPAPVAAVAPACNCPQQAAAATAASTPVRHRHSRHHSWSAHENSSYSESYSDNSESSYSPGPGSAGEYDGAANVEQTFSAQAEAAVWVDGYGRSHYASAAASDDANPAILTAEDSRRRLAPYHAYNSDCDKR